MTERRDDPKALAFELIERSGMDQSLERLAEKGRGAFWLRAWRTGNLEIAWAATAPLLRRDVLAKTAVTCLARQLDGEHLPSVLAWFRSSLGEKIRRLEVEATSPARHADYRKFVGRLPETTIPESRLAAVQEMEEESRGVERHAELERAMRRAMAHALAPLGREDDEDAAADPAGDERLRFWLTTAALFAYDSLTDAEVEAYLRFERSPGGVWFWTLYWACLHETVAATEAQAAAAVKTLARRPER
jgi:hypothetical protein